MSSHVSLKANGLNTSPNALEVQDGSMLVAKNVIIRRQDTVEPRRGFKLYGSGLPLSTDRAKQLFEYQNRIIRHYSNTLQFDDGTGNFSNFSGTYTEQQPGLRLKTVSSNGNLYFTSSQGIQKISALNATQFTTNSGFITPAGGIKALDVTANLSITLGNQTGFLPQDSAVAYRIVWGTNDANSNEILGVPSQRAEIYNYFNTLLSLDINNLLVALDNVSIAGSSLISDGNYSSLYSVSNNPTAAQLQQAVLNAAAKLDNDILIGNSTGTGAPLTISTVTDNSNNFFTLTFSGTPTLANYLTAGSHINLTGFAVPTGTINGTQQVISVNQTSHSITFKNPTTATGNATTIGALNGYSYSNIVNTVGLNQISSLSSLVIDSPTPDQEYLVIQDAIQRIITQLQNELIGIVPSSSVLTYLSSLAITTSSDVNLSFTIPKAVTENYFFQVYRSHTISATQTSVLTQLTPDDEMQLVYEAYPTVEDLTLGSISVLDETPDAFKGAYLYTNSSTGVGIQNANEVPPFAQDINRFKNCVFYANTKTKQIELLNLLGVVNLINDYNSGIVPKLTISDGINSSTYTFVTGLPQISQFTFISDVSGSYNGKYFTLNTAGNVSQYTFYYQTSGSTDTPPSTFGAITGISVANPTVITATAHGLQTGDKVTITNTDSVPSVDGTYFVTVIDSNHFSIPIAVTTSGLVGKWSRDSIVKKINIQTNDTAASIATKTSFNINIYNNDFLVSNPSSGVVGVTNVSSGSAGTSTIGSLPSGVLVSTTQAGRGEDASNRQVLLSQLVSPAQAVDATARSLVRVINQDATSPVYAFYLSGTNSVPGQMELEARSLNTNPFYLISNTSDVGQSFKPDLSPLLRPTITNITSTTNTVLTTSVNHGFAVGQQIIITGSNTTPTLDGIQTITAVNSPTSFTINNVLTVIASTLAVYQPLSNMTPSSNQAKINRIYYSQVNQPEAVPAVNYLDVGGSDKAIIRIFPLRDSLFVFKEDGLYRLSGEVAPFSLALFDSSCFLIAPDSLGVANNLVYCWTTQGISTVAEAGVSFAISRPIDNLILPVQTTDYPAYKTATFGVGYESDNSYTVWTVQNPTDTVATVAYRFSNLTNTWSLFDKTNTCGFVHYIDDKMYLGAADTNYIEQERKDFTRYDYSDRETNIIVSPNKIQANTMQLSSVTNISVGDVIAQNQTLTAYVYNSLLQKLDIDPTLAQFTITSIPIANGSVTITNSGVNNLKLGDTVVISGTDCTPSIDGSYIVSGTPTSTSFTITVPKPITVAGTTGKGRFLYYPSMQITNPGGDARTYLTNLASRLDGDPGINSHIYSSLIQSRSSVAISTSSIGNPGVINAPSHGLITGRYILIQGNTGTSPAINQEYQVTVIDSNNFSIPVNITIAGSGGSFNTDDANFADVQTCYNAIVTQLNQDIGASLNNYQSILNTTTLESVITAVDLGRKLLTLETTLPFFTGAMTVYEAIDCQTIYAPITMGDSLTWKHMNEATLMFSNRAFTSALISFSTDLLPGYTDVPFNSDGTGAFGYGNFGQGFFGGSSNSAPLRTYIPRNAQRCRFLNVKFEHKIAREKFELLGITVTGQSTGSTRAYRS